MTAADRAPVAPLRSAPDEQTALLRELIAEVRALRLELARRHSGPAGADARVIALVQAIAEHFGKQVFSARELCHHASLVKGPLFDVMQALGAETPRKLGRRLSAIAGQPLGGWCIERVGDNCIGAIWTCSASL